MPKEITRRLKADCPYCDQSNTVYVHNIVIGELQSQLVECQICLNRYVFDYKAKIMDFALKTKLEDRPIPNWAKREQLKKIT